MLKWLPLLILLLSPSVHAEIYKWVDERGNVHYGDEPAAPGAEPVQDLPGLSTYAPPSLPSMKSSEEAESAGASTVPAHPGYKVLRIISPEPEATVRSAPGEVAVFVALDPVLYEGDYLQVILDGKALPEKYTSTVIHLNNVDRGEHRISVAVHDSSGKKLKQSKSVTFYLHRTIAKPLKTPR